MSARKRTAKKRKQLSERCVPTPLRRLSSAVPSDTMDDGQTLSNGKGNLMRLGSVSAAADALREVMVTSNPIGGEGKRRGHSRHRHSWCGAGTGYALNRSLSLPTPDFSLTAGGGVVIGQGDGAGEGGGRKTRRGALPHSRGQSLCLDGKRRWGAGGGTTKGKACRFLYDYSAGDAAARSVSPQKESEWKGGGVMPNLFDFTNGFRRPSSTSSLSERKRLGGENLSVRVKGFVRMPSLSAISHIVKETLGTEEDDDGDSNVSAAWSVRC